MPAASPEGVKRSKQRAGRQEEMESPVDWVVFVGEIRPEGAKAIVFERVSTVARTAEDSFS